MDPESKRKRSDLESSMLFVRDMIDREDGLFVTVDRLLKIWVKRTFGN